MPKSKQTRIVVDANIWVSSLLSLRMRRRVEALLEQKYELLFSLELFAEIGAVGRKPKLRHRIGNEEFKQVIDVLLDGATLVDVCSVVDVCRDPKDNFLLALAKDGNADYLITGDQDLLTLKTFEQTNIVTLSEFEKTIEQ